MKKYDKYLSVSIAVLLFVAIAWSANSRPVELIEEKSLFQKELSVPDTTDPDSLLPFPFSDAELDPLDPNPSGLFLADPSNIQTDIILNPKTNEYDVTQKMGDMRYGYPTYLTFQEYQEMDFDKALQKNWRDRMASDDATKPKKGFQPKITVPGDAFATIFGSNTIDIRPQGSAELIFGGNFNRTMNPALPIRQQRVGAFNFQQKIQMNIVGKIGDKIQLQTNYNTETGFNFDNKVNLKYEGKEDEIIQLLEAGNVSMPLTGTLITGSQSLMGVKTKLKFGRLTATTIFSQQQGDKKTINVQGGAQTTQFDISASDYDANRHFFLNQFFKDRYDQSMATLPNVTSPFNVTRIEVYITNRTYATTNVRNIAAFADLAEGNAAYFNGGTLSPTATQPGVTQFSPPRNENNNLQPSQLIAQFPLFRSKANEILNQNPQFIPAVDYEYLQNARLLSPTEYTFNPLLGYVSLNQALNADEVLSVAYQYTINTAQGQQVYQVGEFSTDVQGTGILVLKMLKSTQVFTKKPIWDLMMKNVYSLNGYQISKDNFKLNVLYQDEQTSVKMNVIPEGIQVKGKILLQLFNLDRLNNQNDPQADGFYDFIEGKTIQSDKGRIIFPMREPFKKFLRSKYIQPDENPLANRYAFDSLYVTTKPLAQLDAQHNRFYIQGSYQSASGSEISLNAMNVPQGSVTVTAGGLPLTENVDYTVDYALGRVRIINQGLLNSQTPISISLETNTLFAIQSKRLMGAHFDYKISKDFGLGATVMNLSERPMTQKINIGDEPINNTILGIDGNFKSDSRFLTRLVDKLPFYSTKETSSITASWEGAKLIPGHSKVIGKDGLSYIDDFEGAESSIDIRSFGNWFLASTPSGQLSLLTEGTLFDDRRYNNNRSKINWYTIDPLFSRNGSTTPENVKDSPMQSNNFMRQIVETEIFPNKARPNGQVQIMPVLDMHFNPTLRGPYNYVVNDNPYAKGLNPDGTLKDPRTRWAGIMRRIETNDFESANIDYIEFWMMDPFADGLAGTPINNGTGGDFYINIGNISEDILRDGQQSFENGIPVTAENTNVAYTTWGKHPTAPPLVRAFDNNPTSRPLQDVGLDGLPNDSERVFFQDYLTEAQSVLNADAFTQLQADPSNDDYRFFRSSEWDAQSADILTRYTLYNGLENNSRLGQDPIESYPTANSPLPNIEDINSDNTLSTSEAYFQYRLSLRPQDMVVGQNYIIDKVPGKGELANGKPIDVTWYQFRVPIRSYSNKVGSISDFRSIRFMRMFFHNWQQEVVVRMARLELVRAEWRRFDYSLKEPGLFIGNDLNTQFQVSTVNIEENGDKTPVNYVLPPQIRREVDVTTTNLQQLNEQSLQLRVCNLEDGDARAVFKNTNLDIRAYRRIRMEVHAESMNNNQWPDKQLTAFIRLGTDFVNNYYEYEIPLKRCADGTANPEDIWNNSFNFLLETLTNAKINRNTLMLSDPSITFNKPFYYQDPDFPDNRITVVGVPQISGVKTMMIGIRNPQNDEYNPWPDDGSVGCAEIWVNELRVSDYFEAGGWAANARVTAKLADLGTIALAGSRTTFGFGSIEKKPMERARANTTTYSIISNLELGKFFPKTWNMSIPLYWELGENISNPQFDPLDADVKFQRALDYQPSEGARDSLKQLSQIYTKRRSINFTNVKKNKKQGATKAHFFDVENLDFTYAFSDQFQRSPQVEFNYTKNIDVGLGYTYAPKAKAWEPFKKSKLLEKSKALALIKDFNIGLSPSRIAFRSDIARDFNSQKLRNTSDIALLKIDTTFFKSFTWSRVYDLKYPLTKSLQLDFMATNQSRVDEEPGAINTNSKRDSVIRNLKKGGRNTNYQHTLNASYTIPFSKVPILNWVSGNVSYGATYSWVAAPLVRDSSNANKFKANPFGNSITNSNSINSSGQANLMQLYNKVPYLKKINQKKGTKPKTNKKKAAPKDPKDPNAPKDPKAKKDSTEKKETAFDIILENAAKFLMMLKNVSVTYTETNGTGLPGFINSSQYIGRDWKSGTPTTGFLFGSQQDIRSLMVQRGALTRDTTFNNAFTKTLSKNLTWNATIEPIPGLRITLNANRTYSESFSTIYKYNANTDQFQEVSTLKTGTFSMSTNTWGTAFEKLDNKLHTSNNFQRFLDNRHAVASRLSTNSVNPTTNYPTGFGSTQQDVLLYSFMSTYMGNDPSKQSLSMFPAIPKPNWRITYDGLTKLDFFKKYFKTISLSHSYRSTFNIGSFTTNLLALQNPNSTDQTGNVIPQLNILMASLSEQFGPMLNVDMTWKNSLITKFEMRKTRDLSLSLQNSQITEVNGKEITIGSGYVFNNVELPFKVVGSTKKIKSDLNVRCDVTIRTNKTVVRKIPIEGETIFDPILSAGQQNITIKTTADYVVNSKFTIRLFFDRTSNKPFISNQFPNSNTSFGLSLRFTLNQ